DRGNVHRWGDTPPIGLEVAVTAYTVSAPMAFHRIGRSREETEHIRHATFYRLTLTYQGVGADPAPLDSAYFGLFMDPDLGQFSDDYVGSDPSAEVGYVYNGDDFDEGTGGYGAHPAALGAVMFDGPAEKPLSAFVYWNNGGSVQSNPADAVEAYQYMQALWRDGRPIEFGGSGRDGTNGMPTRYMFPDLPPGYWSEYNPGYGDGISNTPANRRLFISHGPFTLQPGETATVDFALPWAREMTNTLVPQNLASLYRLLLGAVPAVTWLRGLAPDPALATITPEDLPQPLPPLPEPPPEVPERYALAAAAYPNPTTGQATIRYELPEAVPVRLVVYDALGREVVVLVDEAQEAGFHTVAVDASGWASGAYVYHIAAGRLRGSGRLTRVEPPSSRIAN
ncbi:MAG: T9SS type A sorting domain-containing protein, partial [Rhodothermaceae bacterium]|nr:T9SS type A sorting domain-containing protein [Rhodothermaceae bacterium]